MSALTGPKDFLQTICHQIRPFHNQLLFDDQIMTLREHLTQTIAPLLSTESIKTRSVVKIAKSLANVLTVWHSQYKLSNQEIDSRLDLLRGQIDYKRKREQVYRELNNIVNAEKIYQTAMNINTLEADRMFWDEMQPLVERGISTEQASFMVLYSKFPDVDLPLLKSSNTFVRDCMLYRKLSEIFAQHGYWDIAFVVIKCIKTRLAALSFVDLSLIALKQNDEEKAWFCHHQAMGLNLIAGAKSLLAILKHKIELTNDPENAYNQIKDPLTQLLNLDREYGLQCLMIVAKKAIDAQKPELAFAIVAQASKEKKERTCNRDRDHSNDIRPYGEMAEYCLKIKQYELSESFARNNESGFLCWHLEDILLSRLEDQIVDQRLINELYIMSRLREHVVLKASSMLFSQNQLSEIRQLIICYFEGLEQDWRDLLIKKLEQLLNMKAIEIKKWLKQAPEYSKVYSVEEALEDENIPVLLNHRCRSKEALTLYQKHIEVPGVLDLLIAVANLYPSINDLKLAIRGIGSALCIEPLQGQAQQALLALVKNNYNYCSKERGLILDELAKRHDDPNIRAFLRSRYSKDFKFFW